MADGVAEGEQKAEEKEGQPGVSQGMLMFGTLLSIILVLILLVESDEARLVSFEREADRCLNQVERALLGNDKAALSKAVAEFEAANAALLKAAESRPAWAWLHGPPTAIEAERIEELRLRAVQAELRFRGESGLRALRDAILAKDEAAAMLAESEIGECCKKLKEMRDSEGLGQAGMLEESMKKLRLAGSGN